MGAKKPVPKEAFDSNIADAHKLVVLARVLKNSRSRKMRTELRDRVGQALKVAQKHRDKLDCVESSEAFIVLKPTAKIDREHFSELPALLRQAVVAACAALETYIADKTEQQVRSILRNKLDVPPRLAAVPMNVGDWLAVEEYHYRRRGITERVIGPYVREEASTASSKIGSLLSLCGFKDALRKIDVQRKRKKGTTSKELDEITSRRNSIAHSADRRGRGRAKIEPESVEAWLNIITEVVEAIEHMAPDPVS